MSTMNLTGDLNVTGQYKQNGTSLDDKYLGKTAKAADADKLDGQDSTYYLNYNNLTNKPTIPTVNNATLTIQKNGTAVQTFTANASSDVTANITVPTKVSELTNDSGYTTPVTLRRYKFVLKYSSSNDGLEIHAIGYSTATYSSSTTISYVLDAWKSCFGLNVDVPCSGALRSVYFASMLQVLSCRITSTTPDSGTFYFTYLKPYNSSSSTGLTTNSSGSEVNLFGCSVTPIGSMTV